MPMNTSELIGRLITDSRFSDAVKKDPDLVAIVLNLTPEQEDLLKKISANPSISVEELARTVVGSGHGINAGG